MRNKDLLLLGLVFATGYFLARRSGHNNGQQAVPDTRRTNTYAAVVPGTSMKRVPKVSGMETVYYRNRWARPKVQV